VFKHSSSQLKLLRAIPSAISLPEREGLSLRLATIECFYIIENKRLILGRNSPDNFSRRANPEVGPDSEKYCCVVLSVFLVAAFPIVDTNSENGKDSPK
jgi:hypothetical protein